MAEAETSLLQPSGSSSTLAGPGPRPRRETWGSSTERIVTLLGLSIGMGGFCWYPDSLFKAGGVYFIAHLLVMILAVVPLMLMEYFVGQFTSSDCIGVFAHYPAVKGIGIVSCLVTLVILPYLTVISSYSLIYLGHSFANVPQWTSCSNSWNSEDCDPLNSNMTSTWYRNPAFDFLWYNIIQISTSMFDADGLLWPQIVASLMICLLIFFCLLYGIWGLGKVCCFTQGMSLVLLFALLIRAVTLPGAEEGLQHFFSMDINRNIYMRIFLAEAVSFAFFSSGLGLGLYSTLGSYNNFRDNFMKDVLIVSIGSTLFTFCIGIIGSSLAGFIAKETDSEYYVNAGFDLPYVILTTAVSLMPQSRLWAIVVFSLIFFVSFDTLMVMVQVVVQCIQNHISVLRNRPIPVSLVVCALTFINCLLYCSTSGIWWISIFSLTHKSMSLLVGFLEIIVFAYFYGAGRLARDMEMLSNIVVSYYCYFTWLVFTPAVLLLLFIGQQIYIHTLPIPGTTLLLLTMFSLVMVIPVYSIYYVLRGDCGNKYKGEKSAPWAPKAEVAAWKDFCSRRRVRNSLCHRTFK